MTSFSGRFIQMLNEKPKLPCGGSECPHTCDPTEEEKAKGDHAIRVCQKYRDFRKAISEWWDTHPNEFQGYK